ARGMRQAARIDHSRRTGKRTCCHPAMMDESAYMPTPDIQLTRDPHLTQIRPVVARTPQGCEECLQLGAPWVHLRLCLTCGHVGCCDSSPLQHARKHAFAVGHPILATFAPGETRGWCF